jgi:hypothetical protein
LSYYGACKGTTKAGKPCGAVDLFENGRCKHHGGEGQLIRVKLLIAKTLKKTERLKRKGDRFDRMVAQAAKRDPQLAAMLERVRAERRSTKEGSDAL